MRPSGTRWNLLRLSVLYLYSESVQKMCRKCVAPTVRFLVIAAPRPSGLPDLDCIQAGLIGGRFFCPVKSAFGGDKAKPGFSLNSHSDAKV